MPSELVVIIVFALIIGAGLIVVFSSLWHRARILEMAHRERLAMIERGLAPSEVPPLTYQDPQRRRSARSSKLISAGIINVGLGLALALLIGITSGAPEIAVGVGGAIMVLGITLIVTAMVVRAGGSAELELPPPGAPRDDQSLPKPPSV
jgi:hypothetical protein